MKVAIMYSGGKDSNYAVDFAKQKGWDIAYLLSVKPTRKDCYLFHFATVEHTPLQADMLKLPHVLTTCDVADPKKEAAIVKNIVEQNPVDAVVFGGTGLQETQLKSVQEALRPLGIEVFAAHAGLEHEEVMKDMLNKGYRFMITQIASDGLAHWLGKIITPENFAKLKADSEKYGFHVGFEGGYADTFVVESPLFPSTIGVKTMETVMDDAYCGHVIIETSLQKKILH